MEGPQDPGAQAEPSPDQETVARAARVRPEHVGTEDSVGSLGLCGGTRVESGCAPRNTTTYLPQGQLMGTFRRLVSEPPMVPSHT